MGGDWEASATFTRSSALFDSAGALVSWDCGFEIEFAAARDLVAPGATYREIADAVMARTSQFRTLEGEIVDAETIRRTRCGLDAFGTPRSFLYRNPNGQVIRVEETISVKGDVFRVSADATEEWIAKQQLADARKHLEIVQQTPATVPVSFTVAPDGSMRIPQPSVALKRLYGLPDDFDAPDPLGLYSRVEMTAEERAAITVEGRRCLETLEPLVFAYRVRDQHGNLRWIHNSLLPRKQPDGSVVFEGGLRDITSEKLAQDQIELLRAVVVQSSDSVILLETIGGKSRILYVNPAFERLFGRTLTELASTDAGEYSREPIDLAVNRRLRERLAEGNDDPFEFQTLHAHGHLVWVEARACKLQGQMDGTYRWAVISRDISERKRAADELARSEHMLGEAQRMAKIGTWEADLLREDLRWSDGMYQLLGLDPATCVPSIELFQSAVHPDDRDETIRETERVLAGNESYASGNYRIVRPDGTERFLHAEFEVVRDHSGKATRAIGTLQDVTLQRAAELELLNALELAKAADRAKSEFLANMSHELRTPLNAIIGFSELLMVRSTQGLPLEKLKEYLRDIYNSGQHLLDIINGILSLSKIEAGQTALDEELFELPEAINWIFRLLAEKATSAGVALQAQSEAELPSLRADSRLVRQALLNLVSNAIKFSNSGGFVRVHTKQSAGGDLVVTICDSGIGMTPEEVAMALTPFGQVESPLQRRFEGTGLGLPLAKKFIELHGGELTIESAPDKGTSVTVTLPRSRCSYPPELPVAGLMDRVAS